MKQFEIVRKDLAPLQFKFFGILIFLAINYKILTFSFYNVNPLVFIIGTLIAFAIWTAKDILIIDFENNQIKEGFKILGLSYTDKMRFSGFEKIFINKVNTNETFRPLTRTITIHHENYKAFLKTYEGDKYWIGINSDKDKLIKRLKTLNENLKTEIYDYTVQEQVRVD
ncbi:MAG TPA: hypothetical protein VIM65_07815 [Cyclobacteriaceae bacterium]